MQVFKVKGKGNLPKQIVALNVRIVKKPIIIIINNNNFANI